VRTHINSHDGSIYDAGTSEGTHKKTPDRIDLASVDRARLDSGIKLGDMVFMARFGRLLMNEKGEPVRIVHAHGTDDQGVDHFISMPIKRIESALNLELLRFDQWR
jgi:hypothetical protein